MTATRNVKGLLGTKLGMTQVWDENNKLIPVTVVQADSNVITQLRNAETDARNIQVEVQGSKVILRGTVRAYAEKKAAEETAWSAPGVSEVDNRIVVSPIA